MPKPLMLRKYRKFLITMMDYILKGEHVLVHHTYRGNVPKGAYRRVIQIYDKSAKPLWETNEYGAFAHLYLPLEAIDMVRTTLIHDGYPEEAIDACGQFDQNGDDNA